MRLPFLAGALLAGSFAGCMDATTFLVAPRDVFKLETWTTVPEGQQEVHGKVGSEFHLALGPAAQIPALVWLKVSINGKGVACPEFHSTSKTTCYVFRAPQAGQYRIEIWRDYSRRDTATAKNTPASDADKPDTAPPQTDTASWQPRSWNITISE